MIPFTYFKFIKTIGMGTFGRVYLVKFKHLATDRYYALKIMKRKRILQLRQMAHYQNEKNILTYCRSNPFFAKLIVSFETDEHFCFLLEYVCGGELFYWLKINRRFNEYAVRFYAAQICLGLQYLHRQQIIFRDLKPENILLGLDGYLRITDLGFAKRIASISYTVCGTVEYMAPEEFAGDGHGREVDYWSVGVVIYEMVYGMPPFYDDSPLKIHRKICEEEVNFPFCVSYDAMDIMERLLCKNAKERLGHKEGFKEILEHPFFNGIDFNMLKNRELVPPFLPTVRSKGDTINFLEYDENDPAEEGNESDFKRFKIV